MARLTVEDCLPHVDNRFHLVLVASKRARQIAMGAEPMVSIDNDKPTVLALREIAAGKVGPEILNETPPQEPDLETLVAAAAEVAKDDISPK